MSLNKSTLRKRTTKEYTQGSGVYLEPKSGLVAQEVYMVKGNGELAAFPLFVVITACDAHSKSWLNTYKVGDFLELGFNAHKQINRWMIKVLPS